MSISTEKPWLKHFSKEALEYEMPKRTIYDSVKKVAEEHLNVNALYFFGKYYSYRELVENIDRMADIYVGNGVKKYEKVTMVLPNMPESIFTMYALNKFGATANIVDPRMTSAIILKSILDSKSKLLIVLDLIWAKIEPIIEKSGVEKVVVLSITQSMPLMAKMVAKRKAKAPKITYTDKIITWNKFLENGKNGKAEKAEFEENSVAAITYTGGTTGTPKSVLLSNDGLNTMADSFVMFAIDKKPGERFFGIIPIAAAYGVCGGVHMPLCEALCIVIIPKFTPDELGKLMKKYKPNHMIAAPSHYEIIMRCKELEHEDMSFLISTGCGGESMTQTMEDQFNEFLHSHGSKYSLNQGYGMSEMSGAATACLGTCYRDGSAGIPLLATTVGVFDPETGEEKGIGEKGELCMTGRNMMLGYNNNPEETEKVMKRHADGTMWIHSGDIGYIDEDGFVFICGRTKLMIIRFDGHKVYPQMVESALSRHPEVKECAVVGIKDRDRTLGYVPLGVVELFKENETEETKAKIRQELLDICKEHCEGRGQPGDVVFIDHMLYTNMHKHDYNALTEKYKDYVFPNKYY